MRPVFCVPRLSDSPASPEVPDSPMGSPMEVFSLEEEVRAGKTPVPFEQSAAAAAEALHQLEQLLAPSSDAEAMVSRRASSPSACAVLSERATWSFICILTKQHQIAQSRCRSVCTSGRRRLLPMPAAASRPAPLPDPPNCPLRLSHPAAGPPRGAGRRRRAPRRLRRAVLCAPAPGLLCKAARVHNLALHLQAGRAPPVHHRVPARWARDQAAPGCAAAGAACAVAHGTCCFQPLSTVGCALALTCHLVALLAIRRQQPGGAVHRDCGAQLP